MRRLLFRVSQVTAILMAAGWIAVVCTAVFLPGGHPPLSAYVGVAVIVASWILGSIGVLSGLASLAQQTAHRKFVLLFVVINSVLLAFSIVVNFM